MGRLGPRRVLAVCVTREVPWGVRGRSVKEVCLPS